MKTKIYAVILALLMNFTALAQSKNVGIGTSKPNDKALLEISSQKKGLFIPRLSQADRDNITGLGPTEEGLLIYNQDAGLFNFWNSNIADWEPMGKNLTLIPGSNWFADYGPPSATTPTANDGDFYLDHLSGEVHVKEQGKFNLTSVKLAGDNSVKVSKTTVDFGSILIPANNANGDGSFRVIARPPNTITGLSVGDAVFLSLDTKDLPDALYIQWTNIYYDTGANEYRFDIIFMNNSIQPQTVPAGFKMYAGIIRQ